MNARSSLGLVGALLVGSLVTGGCDDGTDAVEDDFSSAQATLLEFEFDGELVTTDTWNLEQTIEDQLLYTIGQLNGSRAVGRLDAVTLTNVTTERLDDGATKVRYHAVLPVGWGSKTNLPTSYELVLPARVDASSLDAFAKQYGHACVESGAHDVSSGNLWYYYRPARSGCSLADGDVVKLGATVSKSALNTDGKYPEYDRVWDDGALRVVAIFGKYEDGTTTSSDAGIAAYGRFVRTVKSTFSGATTTPANAPASPGVANPDVEIAATLSDGRKVVVNALLVDNVASAPASFYERYEGLSTEADLLFYNGHAGLGQNVRALAKKGQFRPGKYQLFFMNGCDTFAYVDGSLAKTRSTLNPDDPTGTKYLDMVTNVMPAFFSEMPDATMALVEGLADLDHPKTYQEIFEDVSRSQVVVVTGEEDNVFTPGGNAPAPWSYAESGVVARGEQATFTLGTLPAGDYVIRMLEDQASPGGDADLYVGVGRVPTLDAWDYRPWLDGSNEEVRLTLQEPAEVNLLVVGYEGAMQATSAFKIAGSLATP